MGGCLESSIFTGINSNGSHILRNISILAKAVIFSSVAAFLGLVLLLILEQFDSLSTAPDMLTLLFAGDANIISPLFFFFLKLLVVALFTTFLYLLSKGKMLENRSSSKISGSKAKVLKKVRNHALYLAIALAFTLYSPLFIYFGSFAEMFRLDKVNIYLLHNLIYAFIPIYITSFLSIFLMKLARVKHS